MASPIWCVVRISSHLQVLTRSRVRSGTLVSGGAQDDHDSDSPTSGNNQLENESQGCTGFIFIRYHRAEFRCPVDNAPDPSIVTASSTVKQSHQSLGARKSKQRGTSFLKNAVSALNALTALSSGGAETTQRTPTGMLRAPIPI